MAGGTSTVYPPPFWIPNRLGGYAPHKGFSTARDELPELEEEQPQAEPEGGSPKGRGEYLWNRPQARPGYELGYGLDVG